MVDASKETRDLNTLNVIAKDTTQSPAVRTKAGKKRIDILIEEGNHAEIKRVSGDATYTAQIREYAKENEGKAYARFIADAKERKDGVVLFIAANRTESLIGRQVMAREAFEDIASGYIERCILDGNYTMLVDIRDVDWGWKNTKQHAANAVGAAVEVEINRTKTTGILLQIATSEKIPNEDLRFRAGVKGIDIEVSEADERTGGFEVDAISRFLTAVATNKKHLVQVREHAGILLVERILSYRTTEAARNVSANIDMPAETRGYATQVLEILTSFSEGDPRARYAKMLVRLGGVIESTRMEVRGSRGVLRMRN